MLTFVNAVRLANLVLRSLIAKCATNAANWSCAMFLCERQERVLALVPLFGEAIEPGRQVGHLAIERVVFGGQRSPDASRWGARDS
jgi:hypothetical protein